VKPTLLAALFVVGIAACGGRSSTWTVNGSVLIPGQAQAGGSCVLPPYSGLDDIASGAHVSVTDEGGKAVATSELVAPTTPNDARSIGRNALNGCVFAFTVRVPADRSVYQFRIGNQDFGYRTADQLRQSKLRADFAVGLTS
jgi:hypothetical protein